MKKLFIYGACALLSLGAVSCHGDDPLANNTVRPEVPATPNSLSGVITDVNGNPVAGATVTLDTGETTTTDANGQYSFENVPAGNHTITVEKDGMFTDTRDITVSGSENNLTYVEGFMLNKETVKTIKVVGGAAVSGEVTSDAIPGNEEGKVEITVDVPAGAVVDANGNPVTDDLEIYVTPIYTSESAKVMDTKAATDEHDMLIGATLRCSKPNLTLTKPVDITFDLDNSVIDVVYAEMLSGNDTWTNVTPRKENGNIIIAATSFTSYGIFIDMTVDTSAGRDNLVFNPTTWDNLNGSANMWADYSAYTYKSGAEITSKATNALEGLLIEHLARKIGNKVQTLNGKYDIKQSISVGAALRIWGNQQKLNWTLTGKLSRKQVKAVSYSTVSIFTEGWLREHNGGGSNN